MKRVYIAMGFVFMAFAVSACGKASEEGAVEEWVSAYRAVLSDFNGNVVKPYDEWEKERTCYIGIHDFDGDEVPELIIANDSAAAVFTCSNGEADKISDVCFPEKSCWDGINGFYFKDNAIVLECSGSDGSGYTCFGYRNGGYVTGFYDDYGYRKEPLLNGGPVTRQEFREVFLLEELCNSRALRNIAGYWVEGNYFFAIGEEAYPAEEFNFEIVRDFENEILRWDTISYSSVVREKDWISAYRAVLSDFNENVQCSDNSWEGERVCYIGIQDFEEDNAPELIIANDSAAAVFTFAVGGEPKKISDICFPEGSGWGSINGLYFKDHTLVLECKGSDGSGYTCFGYRDGGYVTGFYDDCGNEPLINGEAVTPQEFQEVFLLEELCNSRHRYSIGVYKKDGKCFFVIGEETYSAEEFDFENEVVMWYKEEPDAAVLQGKSEPGERDFRRDTELYNPMNETM